MRRIPVGLTDAQHLRLRREAGRRRTSIGALIRAAVEQAYQDEAATRKEARVRAMRVFGAFHSGTSHVSARHDELLGSLQRW
jgi:hypothetical protein